MPNSEFLLFQNKKTFKNLRSYICIPFKTAKSICDLRKELLKEFFKNGNSKYLQPGRICLIDENNPAVLVARSGQSATILFNTLDNPPHKYQNELLIQGKYQSAEVINPQVKVVQLDGEYFLHEFRDPGKSMHFDQKEN